jgi:hypothetical protein
MTRDTHNLKIHPAPFQLVLEGRKPYEIRQADRPFKEGDLLHLQEWDPRSEEYTGRALTIPIATITPAGEWGLPADLCVLGLDVRLYVRERCAAELEAHAAKISGMTPPRCYTGPAIFEVVTSWNGAASFLREQAGASLKLETVPSERASAARDALARVFYWLGLGDEGPESDLPTSEEISALSGGLYDLLEEVRVACVGLGGLLDMEGIARRALGPAINGAGPGCCDLYGTPHRQCRHAPDAAPRPISPGNPPEYEATGELTLASQMDRAVGRQCVRIADPRGCAPECVAGQYDSGGCKVEK